MVVLGRFNLFCVGCKLVMILVSVVFLVLFWLIKKLILGFFNWKFMFLKNGCLFFENWYVKCLICIIISFLLVEF